MTRPHKILILIAVILILLGPLIWPKKSGHWLYHVPGTSTITQERQCYGWRQEQLRLGSASIYCWGMPLGDEKCYIRAVHEKPQESDCENLTI
ncbi:MAG: hypothetical protein A2445_02970 [Candidatus Jacksonbacteria bacterium RIFOXYC2_FULL_44_29]|nr:MAG: hypothetical protein UV19_C0010G0004 [Parcubacteria group bacterium GW2011_GWA2_42_28]KKT53789.1 MAG: hypothetical protein UW45_C0026G0010 [Parcubacteria group bacterium GW2011_GWC2_44_22]OGY76686.1 MAG: hypothetical protein A2240_02190 [Candidatus Jacksonbacteria bacterium RIFOXYA2_FULL_43_12]OGY77596.1 MAG: hypothetical protein A2295_05690 [Candidatus Jacksonbacteria bacterium RIFOXYB2_FULL_44_15]OGY79718.1 MAG: hypothetical protein A2550_05665 [Candidatus Jacksonbacteria bacterium RI